ncbi:hypothetical protein [Clostridium sp. FP2]|uniref:hypothetical protein n=1 Tax=Clostridium sp. FP2 TaxID=2724481 RepID=UPI0013E91350|nr:hypothetical protein [Clostridium sp. FP2]
MNVLDHFAKGAQREIEDLMLSRYACYLIVQNADSRKKVVALGQPYFASQTRKQGLINNFKQESEDKKMLAIRNELVNLFGFSEKLLKLDLQFDTIEECKLNAINSIVQHIPPEAQGKDSTKECIIFEEALFISNLLRSSGFSKKIVFASSNTKKYYKDRNPIPKIADELEKFKIEIATSLNEGYYIAQK